MAFFIARISKGRTIRQTVAATLILPALADFLWCGVVGAGVLGHRVGRRCCRPGRHRQPAGHQTASSATAFPLMFPLLALLYGTFKGLQQYREERD